MPSADDQPRVGEKVPRKNTNDKTRTSERGDAKQPRDGTIVGADLMAGARPPSPTSILLDDDQAATGSDSDGEADSGTYIFDRHARLKLVVDGLLARPEARGFLWRAGRVGARVLCAERGELLARHRRLLVGHRWCRLVGRAVGIGGALWGRL